MYAHTVDKYGRPGMPTKNWPKVRKMLKDGRAVIYKHNPFTIMLTYAEELETQEVELCMDAGYEHIGVSVKSEKHEYAHEQYDLLTDEKQRHDERRKYRRTRRNRLRYRKPRFNNRKKEKGWIAPSLENKAQRHADIIKRYAEVTPITKIVVETASFDTQLLKAIEEGKPIPEGKDYQHGERYGIETLREAVFFRDGYKCQICNGKSNNKILRVHHIGFWKTPSDHTDRMGNLLTVCDACHTQKNHKPGGKLYGLNPKLKPLTGAAFMNSVRYKVVNLIKEALPEVNVETTFGAMTKVKRHNLHLEKTHANDAYSMGEFHPRHKAKQTTYQKTRRNNRSFEKFYDAVFIDIRDGKQKKGAELSTNRTNRKVRRNNPNNERIFRKEKIKKGQRRIRTKRYAIQPGDIILYENKKYTAKGIQNKGEYVALRGHTPVAVKKVKVVKHTSGWQKVS